LCTHREQQNPSEPAACAGGGEAVPGGVVYPVPAVITAKSAVGEIAAGEAGDRVVQR